MSRFAPSAHSFWLFIVLFPPLELVALLAGIIKNVLYRARTSSQIQSYGLIRILAPHDFDFVDKSLLSILDLLDFLSWLRLLLDLLLSFFIIQQCTPFVDLVELLKQLGMVDSHGQLIVELPKIMDESHDVVVHCCATRHHRTRT